MTKLSTVLAVFCLVQLACGEDDKSPSAADAGAQDVPVDKFCDAYEATCGFGKEQTFSDREDCEDDYMGKFDYARRRCAAEHLELAEDDPGAHCEAAKGDEVCRI